MGLCIRVLLPHVAQSIRDWRRTQLFRIRRCRYWLRFRRTRRWHGLPFLIDLPRRGPLGQARLVIAGGRRDGHDTAATSRGTGSAAMARLVVLMPPMTAPMKNNTALTCSSRTRPASVSVLAAISPTQAVAMSAESRPMAFWIAEAIPPCAGSTDDKFSEVSGVIVTT